MLRSLLEKSNIQGQIRVICSKWWFFDQISITYRETPGIVLHDFEGYKFCCGWQQYTTH